MGRGESRWVRFILRGVESGEGGRRGLSNKRRSCGRVTSAANLTPSFLSSPTIGPAARVAEKGFEGKMRPSAWRAPNSQRTDGNDSPVSDELRGTNRTSGSFRTFLRKSGCG